MSKTTIEDMRNTQEFISWDKWPNELQTNCIAYALGLPIDDPKYENFVHMLTEDPIGKLEEILTSLRLCYRQVSSEAKIEDNEYGIVLYHYFYESIRNAFGCKWTEKVEEVHLVRIELDGTWTHKFGWGYDASITTPKEIHDTILRDDGVEVSPTAFFAVRKP